VTPNALLHRLAGRVADLGRRLDQTHAKELPPALAEALVFRLQGIVDEMGVAEALLPAPGATGQGARLSRRRDNSSAAMPAMRQGREIVPAPGQFPAAMPG
jgi:hypothetical protein